MAYFLGQHKVVTIGPLKMWAEKGLIHTEDSRDNSYNTMSWKEALYRINAISEYGMDRLKKGVKSKKNADAWYDKLERDTEFVEKAIELIREAREQGTPDDPDARKESARRKPTSVSIPTSFKGELKC